MENVWFVTGASRGLGAEVVQAALAAGDKVVATGREPGKILSRWADHSSSLLALPLDVTDEAQAQVTVQQAVETWGRLDVLVNNAGYGQWGALRTMNRPT